ncbi:hypothetical protein Bca52824_038429 [Brassica carinata]|uniref:DUF659 domain-containing protein n=1 Tax=Brassica carinata TaxID=52824 RepID=A0A8X7RRV7_BRACI|nr:hypothetical protein Bca52824_038429 [Brassica carinata]
MSTSTKQMDPTRKYATADTKKLGCWICNFCGKTMNGGVLRVKHHLVGGFSTVTLCPKVTDHVREKIKAFLLNKANAKAALQMQQPAFDYDEEVEEPRPSQPNLKKRKGPMDKFVGPTPPDVLKGRKDRKDIYGVSIPFNAANYDSFKEALELVGRYGSGFKPPSMYELRVPFLIKEVKEVENLLVEHKTESAAKGCSIMYDGWRDSVVQKDIINFVVNSPKGSVFIKSVDFSEAVKDANLLFSMLDRMVDEVGEANVIQVVTDNASNYVKARRFSVEASLSFSSPQGLKRFFKPRSQRTRPSRCHTSPQLSSCHPRRVPNR